MNIFTWDNIRRTAGLLFLAYLIVVNPEGIPIWVGALIAGLLGLFDVGYAFAPNGRRR